MKRRRRNPIRRPDRDLRYEHYRLTDAEAGKLCKPFGGLPKHGYERLVETDEGVFWVNRTPLSSVKRGWAWCAYPAAGHQAKPKRMNPDSVDEDFVQFCRQATDRQLENILADEYARHQHGDYSNARIAAAERGWTVRNGERI